MAGFRAASFARPQRSVFTAAADFLLAFPAFFLIVGLQSPGQIVSDTKYDLLVNPNGFLGRSLNLWTDQSFAGQVQNQSYGYFFPHGAFFAFGDFLGIPPWIVERAWWALALTIGFTGILRLARALGIGRLPARLIGAVAYVSTPKVLVSLGTISSEIWPMMLAPWALLAIHAGLSARMTARRAGAGAALAVALMGAVNAVATVAACVPAALWLISFRPNRTWRRLAAWWVGLSAALSLWWLIPLFLLGGVAPPFLDYIESSGVTSRWAAAAEALRGTSYWVPFVSPDIPVNAALITTPGIIVATLLLAVAGVAGLAWSVPRGSVAERTGVAALPHRGRLIVLFIVGLCLLTAAFIFPSDSVMAPSSPLASLAQTFLDGPGAPLRNLHKFEPVLRIPLVMGLIYLIDRAAAAASTTTLRSRVEHVERHPGLAVVAVIVMVFAISAAPVWRGELAANGPHAQPADHWQQAAQWLADNAPQQRALIAPAAPFGVQVWGTSRDEPIQPLAQSPWTVRDAIPLQPAPAIRAADSVQRVFDAGRPSPGLATTLAQQGIGFVVVRADLRATDNTTRPAVVERVLRDSGGFTRVATFGADMGAEPIVGDTATATVDHNLRPAQPAIEIYRVDAAGSLDPYTVPLNQVPVVAGGPESLARLDELATQRLGAAAPATARLLAADARPLQGHGVEADVIGTDTPTQRETDFGRVSQSSSGIREADAPRDTRNPALDYAAAIDPAAEPHRTSLHWRGGRITASSSAAQTSQVGAVRVGQGVAALADGDERTAWHSRTGDGAFGQKVRIDLDAPRQGLSLRVTLPTDTIGTAVNRLSVRTAQGSVIASVAPGQSRAIALAPGQTDWVEITATGTESGTRGTEFAVSELELHAHGEDVLPRPQIVVPPQTDAPAPAQPAGWVFGTDYPGRNACLPTEAIVACADALSLGAEEPGRFARTFTSSTNVEVRPVLSLQARPGAELDELLRTAARDAGELTASGEAALDDPLAGPLAAVDGNPASAWLAHDTDDAETGDAETGDAAPPELTVSLPRPAQIGGVRLWPPHDGAGGVPQRVELSVGERSLEVDLREHTPLPDGSWRIDLPFTRTDAVTIRVLEWSNVRDSTDPTVALPPAIGDVRLLDSNSAAIAPPFGSTSPLVTVPCAAGPTVSLVDDGGQQLGTTRLTLRGPVDDIRAGAPVLAAPCDEPLPVSAGTQHVQVDPGAAWTVRTVELRTLGVDTAAAGQGPAGPVGEQVSLGTPEQTRGAVGVEQWTADQRRLVVQQAAPASGSLLVIPQSFNTGWQATLHTPDGDSQQITAVAVGGWQQGWIIPAGTPEGAVLDISFPANTTYRLALATGPIALLFVVWLWLARGRDHAGSPSQPRRGSRAAWVSGGMLGSVLLGGLPGALLYGVALAAMARLPRGAAPIVIGILGGIAGMMLARAPWPGANYGGESWAAQLLTVAVVAVVLARAAQDRPPQGS